MFCMYLMLKKISIGGCVGCLFEVVVLVFLVMVFKLSNFLLCFKVRFFKGFLMG